MILHFKDGEAEALGGPTPFQKPHDFWEQKLTWPQRAPGSRKVCGPRGASLQTRATACLVSAILRDTVPSAGGAPPGLGVCITAGQLRRRASAQTDEGLLSGPSRCGVRSPGLREGEELGQVLQG